MEQIKVLFVCLGNICRSPMAEALFVHHVQSAGLHDRYFADSAGIGNWHEGELADARTRAVLQNYGIACPSVARQIRPRDLSEFHYILNMEQAVHEQVLKMHQSRQSTSQVLLMRQFDPQIGELEPDYTVPDPYYKDDDAFELVYQILDRSCLHFIQHLESKHQ